MALPRKFFLSLRTQQFLAGVGSASVRNVVMDRSYTGEDPVIPSDPDNAVRRAVVFSSLDAAPTPDEYDIFLRNTDGTVTTQITFER
jgi:hypothetical protein